MRALDLCLSCKRHVRVADAQCPFCGAERTGAASRPLVASLPRGRPGGRAALFLAGVATAGCDREEEVVVPVYGVPVDASIEEDGSLPEGGATSPDASEPPMAQPVYGVAIDAGTPSDAGSGDASMGCEDAARPEPDGMVQPVYGVPIDAALEEDDDAKPRDEDAGVCGDAGVEDADVEDAGVGDENPVAIPVYGVPIDDVK